MSQNITNRMRHLVAGTLLVQAGTADWQQAIDCSDRPRGGLVLTGGDRILDVAKQLLRHGRYGQPVLVDRARYTGTATRKLAAQPFDPTWINQQRGIGLAAVIPDSGYVGQGDGPGLTSILTRARLLLDSIEEDVIALLPLHVTWLTEQTSLDMLISEITQAGVPIAVLLEHKRDPLAIRKAVNGLIQLLTVPVPVLVLRCDIAALGALAYGAIAAAVGTNTTLRHLYPTQPRGGGGFTPAPQIAAIVKPCLTYYSQDKIHQIIQVDPDNHWWRCDCDHCGGRRLDRIWASHDPGANAFLHSINTLYDIRDDIIGLRTTPTNRQQSWASQCSHALFIHETIRETLPAWTLPPGLKYWAERFTPIVIPQPDPGSESPGKQVPPPTD